MPARDDRTVEFRRPAARVLLDLFGAPIGAVLFLVAAVAVEPASPIAVIGFGFFGLLMAVASPASIRRGRAPILIVSPRGLETPESGLLRWDEIAEVRVEVERRMGGPGRHPRRIGIVPVDPARQPSRGLRLAGAMVDGYFSLVSQLAGGPPDARDRPAPFSVAEWELTVPIERVVTEIERYRPVVDAAAREARREASGRAGEGAAAPLTPAVIGEIDARLAPGATGERASPTFVGLPAPSPPVAWAASTAFHRRSPGRASAGVVQAVLFVLSSVFVLAAAMAQAGRALDSVPVVFWVPLGVVLAFAAVRGLRAVAHARSLGPGPVLIEVGPDGVRTPEVGSLAWDEIADVHVAGVPSRGPGPSLVIVPHDPLLMPDAGRGWSSRSGERRRPLQAIVVEAAELDGDFDRLVDLVRSYWTVERPRR